VALGLAGGGPRIQGPAAPVSARAPLDPTGRFTDRVADYVRARPGYPPALLELLERECGLGPAAEVADVGSGTGVLTALLLERARRVYAVEPNAAMAAAAEERLGAAPGFVSVRARAEDTTLPAASVDLVTAAQALHWFEPDLARREFARILRPGGAMAVVWNSRRRGSTPFLRAYEELLERFGTDYHVVRRLGGDQGAAHALFGGAACQAARFDYAQQLDRELLRARLLSSSYVPAAHDPRRAPMLDELDALFDAHQMGGTVAMEYDTEVFWGVLEPVPR
jgi:SAM-dependent methyltransferase